MCARREAEHAGFFTYRSRNLRFVIERALYFWGIENETLFDAFNSGFAGGPERAREILDGVIEARILGSDSHISRLPRLAQSAYELLRRIRSRIRQGITPKPDTGNSFRSSRAVETLFFLHDPKFVRFLGTVLNGLGESAAIFATERPGAFRSLTRYRFISGASPRLTWGSAGRGLAGFPYFLESFDIMSDVLRRERPLRAVVVEGNSPIDELVNQAASGLGIPTVCVQQGWSPVVHSGFRNLSYSRMLVWGEGFADLLRPYSPDERFVPVGNPSLPDKSASDVFSRKRISFFLQAPTRLITREAWTALLDLAAATARANPDVEIVLREHPAHRITTEERARLEGISNIVFAPSGAEPLGDVLARSSLAVSMYSSTIMESIAAGVLPVIANFSALPKYWPDLQAQSAAIEVNNPSDALAAITRSVSDRAYYESFQDAMRDCASRYFTAKGKAAAEKIIDCIRATGANPL